MHKQNYLNHRRLVFSFHFLFLGITLIGFTGSCINLYQSYNSETFYSASLIVLLFVTMFSVGYFSRAFALKAQDRAIKAEENLRFYILTGELHDPSLRISQIIALRFANDSEFVELSKKAATENLRSEKIKRMIKNWKPDFYRV